MRFIYKKPKNRFKGLDTVAHIDLKKGITTARPDIAQKMYDNLMVGAVYVYWDKKKGTV
jgi:hypothetical protein